MSGRGVHRLILLTVCPSKDGSQLHSCKLKSYLDSQRYLTASLSDVALEYRPVGTRQGRTIPSRVKERKIIKARPVGGKANRWKRSKPRLGISPPSLARK